MSLDEHFQYYSNLLNLIPLPKLQENDSDSDDDNLRVASINSAQNNTSGINGNLNGEIVKLPPDKLWEKYQSKMAELQGTRGDGKSKKNRVKESVKSKVKTKKVKKSPNLKKKPVTKEKDSISKEDIQFSQLKFKSNINLNEVMPKKKNYSNLFIQAEKKQRKLEALKEKDPTLAEKAINSDRWDRVMGKIEGRKQRDDVKKLHQSWKQVQKRKQTSRKQMKDRFSFQEKQIKEKQDKRSRHIRERRENKLKNKIKKRRNK